MSDILVTVVLPVYNVEEYLDRAMESIVNQTYKNLEIIMVDDASPDNCPEMCDEWAKRDNRIRVIHKENEGLGMARNSGIEAANGDYICFFDSDDFVETDLIEKCVEVLKDTSAQIVVFGYDRIDQNGKTVGSSAPELPKPVMSGSEIRNFVIPCLAGPMIKDGVKYHMSSSAWAAMYSMHTIRENQFRFVSERGIISEDTYSNLIYYQYVDCIAIIPSVFYHYCDNNAQSLTKTFNPERFELNKHFYTETIRLCDKLGYNEQAKINLSNQMLSNMIATIKQVVASSLIPSEKRALVRKVLYDDISAKVIANYDQKLDDNLLRKLLIKAMQYKRVNFCYFLLWLKQRT